MPKKIGNRFAMLRRAKHLLTREVAGQIGISVREIMIVEQGGIYQYASLQVYSMYAEYLGVELRDIFQRCVINDEDGVPSPQGTPTSNPQARHVVLQQHEDVVREHVQEVMQTVIAVEGKASLSAVVREMHIPSGVLRRYASINAIWKQALAEMRDKEQRQNQQRDNDLFEQVVEAIATLRANRQLLTRESIREVVGVSMQRLEYYDRVGVLLRHYPVHSRPNQPQ